MSLSRPSRVVSATIVLMLVSASYVSAKALPERLRAMGLEPVEVEKVEPQPDLPYKHLTECIGGTAGGFDCSEVDLFERMTNSSLGGGNGNDLWGWTDPQDGKEYALMGLTNGTAFVDISDPGAPIHLGNLATQTGNSTWRDIKVYDNHAYIVSEASDHGMQVFDLTQLRNVASPPATFSVTAHYAEFGNAHNIVINEDSGYAYGVGTNTCSGGLHMIDLSTPASPSNAGCFSGDGYTHDAQCVNYAGPDPDHQGKEICFNSNEDTITVVDVTDKNNPAQLSRTGYAGAAYTHQGWLTEDHLYFLLDDEVDESNSGHNTRTYIWDVSDLDSPVLTGNYTAATSATDHNQYVLGNFVYQANYSAGLRVLDISDIANGNLTEVAFFDTTPQGGSGAWSVYPYFASGNVIVSDIGEGLFVLRPNLCTDPAAPGSLAAVADGDQQIELDWTATAPVGGTYNVYRSLGTCPGANFEQVASGLTGTSYTDSGVSGQVDYAYYVTASDETSRCESPASTCASASTTGACTAPPSFAGVTDATTPGTAACAIDVDWSAASANCGGAVSYSVYRDTNESFTPSPANRIAVDVTATEFTDGEVIFDQLFYYIVHAVDDGNGSEDGNSIVASASASGPVIDGTFQAGAEPGDPFMQASTGANFKHVGWEFSDARVNSGTQSYYSTYADDACLVLNTPSLELTAGETSEMAMWSVFDIEFEWDGGVVQISDNDGATWSLLSPSGGYPGSFRQSTDACGFDQGDPSFTGTDLTWDEYVFDLAPYAGDEVRIRWLFSTDGASQGEGWYLDDVSISHTQVAGSCDNGGSIVFFDGFESGDTSAWSLIVP